MKINLTEIITALDGVTDTTIFFLDTETNECVPYVDDDGFNDGFNPYTDRYIQLPDSREIDNYSIMVEFANTINNDKLIKALIGHGAFARFRDTINGLQLKPQWEEFRTECYTNIAKKWCRFNDISYVEEAA